jgi:uncharacterized protein
MTSDGEKVSVRTRSRNKVKIHRLEERVGDAVAFLTYAFDGQNNMTIWHTEVPPSLRHKGIGGRLVEQAIQLASINSSRLRLMSSFAKEYLARHPELKERYAIRLDEDSFDSDLNPYL